MFCTNKEQETCEVEKRGCEGCYYNGMSKEEVQKVLDELYAVRPEMLNDKAKRLFDAIMKIADERDIYEEFILKINNLNPMLPKATDLDALYEHIETAIHEFNRLEDLEDTTIEMQACIDGLKEKIKEHEQLEEEMTAVIRSARRENDHKLRTIWLMAEEIKAKRYYTYVDPKQWEGLTEEIAKEYFDKARTSRDKNDGDHIPRID